MAEDAKTKPLMTKAALVERVRGAFENLLQSIGKLTDEQMLEPVGEGKWSWKDIVAHIAAWEDILVRFHLGGAPFDEVIQMRGAQYRITTYDAINEHLFQRFKTQNVQETKSYLQETHEAVMQALQAFPEEDLHQPHPRLSVGSSATVTWIDYIAANTYEHYEEHLVATQS